MACSDGWQFKAFCISAAKHTIGDIMGIYEQADREVERIEADENLTAEETQRQINNVMAELRELEYEEFRRNSMR